MSFISVFEVSREIESMPTYSRVKSTAARLCKDGIYGGKWTRRGWKGRLTCWYDVAVEREQNFPLERVQPPLSLWCIFPPLTDSCHLESNGKQTWEYRLVSRRTYTTLFYIRTPMCTHIGASGVLETSVFQCDIHAIDRH